MGGSILSINMLATLTDESRRQRWEDKAEWPLTTAAVLFLIAYAARSCKPTWSVHYRPLANP
jgi:hypothetical protein